MRNTVADELTWVQRVNALYGYAVQEVMLFDWLTCVRMRGVISHNIGHLGNVNKLSFKDMNHVQYAVESINSFNYYTSLPWRCELVVEDGGWLLIRAVLLNPFMYPDQLTIYTVEGLAEIEAAYAR